MKSMMLAAAISCMISAGAVMASVSNHPFQNNWAMKGYMTVGRSVVVLPERLLAGDRIELFNGSGVKVRGLTVGTGYITMNVSTLPKGVYSLVVYRTGQMITSRKIALVGNGKR
ncbi:MAG: hypothetical protein JXA18_05015 [Chitinispirillaceae bacterium]|nr:hypothetical protein [Chitinispirillaceae bacterium]